MPGQLCLNHFRKMPGYLIYIPEVPRFWRGAVSATQTRFHCASLEIEALLCRYLKRFGLIINLVVVPFC